VSDGLWKRIEPLMPKVERSYRNPGHRRLPDREDSSCTAIRREFVGRSVRRGVDKRRCFAIA
jgi:transposase